ncbi:MAG TPA: cytochrome c maturation protein CcmE [Nitrolancea sp.]|nr:cytochrome c maturation protein CcmE [Nitrolancea sp.]
MEAGAPMAQPVAAAAERRFSWVNPKLLIAGIAILLAVGYLIFSAMQGSASSYFVTVGELQQQSVQMDGKRVRVGGDVVPGTIDKGNAGDPIRFVVGDGTHSIPVVYNGVLPDIFTDNTQVVIEGTYHTNGTFEASTLLTKCPSRFTAKPSQ